MLSSSPDLSQVRRPGRAGLCRLARPGNPRRRRLAPALRRRLHKKSQFYQCLKAGCSDRQQDPGQPRSGLPGAPPAAGLAAEPARPARHGRSPGRRGHRRSSAASSRSARSHAGFAASPDVSIQPAPSAAWIEAFCTYSPVRPEHRDTMRAHAARDRRAGGLRLRRGGGPADGHGDRRGAGRPHGPVRRAGDAACPPPRPGAQGHREPLCLGVVGTARASPICRSSRPTKRRCRSTPRKVSAPCTTTSTSCRAYRALTLRPPPSIVEYREEHTKWRTILGRRATRPA